MSGQNRRQFLQAVGLAVGTLTSGTGWQTAVFAQQPGAQVGVRRDVSTLDPNGPEIRALRAGVAEMKRRSGANERDPLGWAGQAAIHARQCPHANWYFLPWHRAYVLYFERICRQASGDQSFMLPYWNWTANPRIPQPFWGSSDNPLFHPRRAAGPNDEPNEGLVGQRSIDDILATPDFETFASPSG